MASFQNSSDSSSDSSRKKNDDDDHDHDHRQLQKQQQQQKQGDGDKEQQQEQELHMTGEEEEEEEKEEIKYEEEVIRYDEEGIKYEEEIIFYDEKNLESQEGSSGWEDESDDETDYDLSTMTSPNTPSFAEESTSHAAPNDPPLETAKKDPPGVHEGFYTSHPDAGGNEGAGTRKPPNFSHPYSFRDDDSRFSLTTPPSWLLVIMGILIVLCIAGLVVGLILGKKHQDHTITRSVSSSSPHTSPITLHPVASPSMILETASPTSYNFRIYSLLATVAGNAVLIQGTPAYAAAKWILYQDPARTHYTINNNIGGRLLQVFPGMMDSDVALIQRFLLALLYFSTSNLGQSPWLSCNPPTALLGENITDCVFQNAVSVVNNQIVYQEAPGIRWLSAASECQWQGVSCATFGPNDQVTAISIGV